jgi:hypothetical protein
MLDTLNSNMKYISKLKMSGIGLKLYLGAYPQVQTTRTVIHSLLGTEDKEFTLKCNCLDNGSILIYNDVTATLDDVHDNVSIDITGLDTSIQDSRTISELIKLITEQYVLENKSIVRMNIPQKIYYTQSDFNNMVKRINHIACNNVIYSNDFDYTSTICTMGRLFLIELVDELKANGLDISNTGSIQIETSEINSSELTHMIREIRNAYLLWEYGKANSVLRDFRAYEKGILYADQKTKNIMKCAKQAEELLYYYAELITKPMIVKVDISKKAGIPSKVEFTDDFTRITNKIIEIKEYISKYIDN